MTDTRTPPPDPWDAIDLSKVNWAELRRLVNQPIIDWYFCPELGIYPHEDKN